MIDQKSPQQSNISTSSVPISELLRCGYNIFQLDKIANKWKCSYCQWIMKEPIQLTECGHRGCKECFESRAALATDGMMTCPVEECLCAFHKDQVGIVFPSSINN